MQSTNRVRIDTFEVWSPFLRVRSESEPDACLNLVGIDRLPSTGAKAIAEAELHKTGGPDREASHDLIGKPGILVFDCGPGGHAGEEVICNSDNGGEAPIVEKGSQTEPGIGTHPPLGIAVVDIAHERLGLEFSVYFYGDGRAKPFETCRITKVDFLREVFGGGADTGFLVSPFNLGREAFFEGVAEGRCKTGCSFKINPFTAGARLLLWVVWENG